MDKTEKTTSQDVLFNIGLSHSQLIGSLIQTKSQHYLAGELSKWFFDLKEIKKTIISHLKEHEREYLKRIEKLISRFLSLQQRTIIRNKEATAIELYETRIMEHLVQYHYLPMKKDASKLFDQDD